MENYSVLMSVYHKEKPEYLVAAVESILHQTVRPEQFILVEDGPLTPELYAVIEKYAGENPEMFTVVKLEQNQGLAVALDTGIKHSRNELIARMDSDDISLPERCEKQLQRFAQNPKLALLGANIDEFYDTPDKIVSARVVPEAYEQIVRTIRRRDPFNHPTVMYKKSEVIRCGGYGTMRRGEDFCLFSSMINMGCYAENIGQSLLYFRSNEDNYKRRKSWASCSTFMQVVKRNYDRGYCSLFDLLYVIAAQMAVYLMPLSMMKWISDKFLRQKK